MELVRDLPADTRVTTSLGHDGRSFVPALEGVRGWAVLAVLLFHGEVLHARGGFLGVSVFFTLSGYLITTLAFVELSRTGHFAWRAFIGRRIRRLFPVAAVGVGLAVIVTLLVDDPYGMDALVGDGLAALGQVSNWRLIAHGNDYGALFAEPSAFAHYWSLSIEEQFYMGFALVVGVWVWRAQRRGGARVRPLRVAMWAAVGWAVSAAIQVSGVVAADVAYYATFTRVGEILAGVGLAGLLAHRPALAMITRGGGGRAHAIGVVGAAVVVAGWFVVTDPTGWITRGGLAVYSLASAATVTGALASRGVVAAVTTPAAVQWMGRLSYALYVVHWPVFVLLDEPRVTLAPWGLFALRLATSLALAWVCTITIEVWARRGDLVLARRAVVGTAAAAVSVMLVGGVVANARLRGELSLDQQERVLEATAAAPSAHRVRLIAVGDSTALRTVSGLAEVLSARNVAQAGGGDVEFGCGLARAVRSRRGGEEREVPTRCDWTSRFAATVARTEPDVVVVQFGPWETEEQQIEPGQPFRHLGDAAFDRVVSQEMRAAVRVLSARGAKVVWLDIPSAGDVAFGRALADIDLDEFEHRRLRFNELLHELPRDFPGTVAVIDVSRWLDIRRNDTDLLPDGVHLSPEGSVRMADEWLADEMEALFDEWDLRP